MEPESTDLPGEEKVGELDLSSLLKVDFISQNWKEEQKRSYHERDTEGDSGRGGQRRGDQRGNKRDRRAGGQREDRNDTQRDARRESAPERTERRGRDFERRQPMRERERKLVHVQFFPEENAFNALVKALRQSGQTHELFTLTKLFLEKPERLMIAISPLESAGPEARLFVCKIDGAPFLTEDEVYQHVFQNHLGQFAVEEQIEVDAPKGNFQSVARCPKTGVILCPPNYHLYPQAVQEHKQRYFPEESVDAVRNRLELVRDEEVIQSWLSSMTRKTRYRLLPQKDNRAEAEKPEGDAGEGVTEETLQFDGLEALKTWLREHMRHRIVKTMRQYRVEGKKWAEIPDVPIKRSVDIVLDEQRRFPLDTANLLRGRFRRLKFDLFKHSGRGINYVCPIKRKVRDSRTPWSEGVEKLYSKIESLPVVTIQTLVEAVLGHPLEYYQSQPANLNDADKSAYASLIADLHWLVMEGYVTRFEDGHLEIPKAHHLTEPDHDHEVSVSDSDK